MLAGFRGIRLIKNQKRTLWIGGECHNFYNTSTEQRFDHGRRTIANPNPHHLGRIAIEKAALVEVCVLRRNSKTMLSGIPPDSSVRGILQAYIPHMLRIRIFLLQGSNESMGKVLIEQQLHDCGIDTSFRSRSAAKARQARISSRVRSGKSRRISSSLMPEARYSSTS